MTSALRTVPTEGRWLLRTAASGYILDLDQGTAIRIPGDGAGLPGDRSIPAPRLPGDDSEVALHLLAACEIGLPARMLIDTTGTGDVTLRITSPVRSLERLN